MQSVQSDQSQHFLTDESGGGCEEDGQLVVVEEPGAHGEESEVHGGGGGQEGGARDVHPGAGGQQGKTQPAHVGSELAENSAVEIDLRRPIVSIFSIKQGNIFTSAREQRRARRQRRK